MELKEGTAIVAIIANIAIVTISSIRVNQNLKKSTNTLTQDIKTARTKAILEKRQITLKLASSANNAPTILNWMQEGKVALKTPANDELKFDGNGVLVSTFSVVELCKTSGASTTNPTSSKKITLTKFGQIEKIEDGSCP